jgi:CrcB protein
MIEYLVVAAGAALGGVLRFWVGSEVHKFVPPYFPWGTLLINTLGSFLLGFFAFYLRDQKMISPQLWLFLSVGFCGGFTTFSTFSLETVNLLRNAQLLFAALNVLASMLLCIGGALLAYILFAK